MTLPVVLALVALSLADPSGDAFGDGGLTPPTAPVYAETAVFDLQSVDLEATEGGTRLTVTLGSLGPAAGTAGADEEPGDPAQAAPGLDATETEPEAPLTGFLPSIVDVYLGEAEDGPDRTLAGPDLLFPQGAGWRYAVRLTGDGAFFVDHEGGGAPTVPPPDEEAEPTPDDGGVDALVRHPLEVFSTGTSLVVYLPFELPEDVAVQALVGVYDPFSSTGWRPLAPARSPWAFSGPGTQASPVVDLLARDAAAQRDALQSGVLPRRSAPAAMWTVPWLWLVVGGLLIAATGLVLRARVPRPASAAASESAASAAATGAGEPPEAGVDGDTEPLAPADPGGRPGDASGGEHGDDLAGDPDAAPDGDLAEDLDEDDLNDEDLDDELIDPRASAADVLAREVAVAEAAGAADQDLLVDGHEEFLLDTGEREAAEQAAEPPSQPQDDAGVTLAPDVGEAGGPAEGVAGPAPLVLGPTVALEGATGAAEPPEAPPLEGGAARFATAFDDYLLDLDDPEAVDTFLGEFDDEESFWHPRSRKSQVRPPAGAAAPEGGASEHDAPATAEDEAGSHDEEPPAD